MNAPTAHLTTFHLFTRLAPELRLRIWKLAAFPRVVSVVCLPREAVWPFPLHSPNPVPAVLHVCREARSEANYVKAFSMKSWPQYVWVSFDLDTMKMKDDIHSMISVDERVKIQRLILTVEVTNYFPLHGLEKLYAMRGLQDLTLLSTQDLSTWAKDLEEYEEGFTYALGHNKEWRCPKMTIVHVDSGEILNLEKSRKCSWATMGSAFVQRGRGGGRGCGRGGIAS